MSCVVVLGCFRSGTSAVAGILNHLGVFMGKKFDPPTANNKSGYWEDIEFKKFHSKFDLGEHNDDSTLVMSYIDLIRSREKEHKLWGLKDPLLCVHLPRLVVNLMTDCKLVVCRRPVQEIAESMGRALKQNNLLRFLPLAEYYVEKMNHNIAEYRGPMIEMDHENTLNNPEFHINRLCNFLSVSPKKEALEYIKNHKK
jgi:hypothetical protein